MSRSSWQSPKLKTRESAQGPQWYIRYRVWTIEIKDGKPTKVRKPKHHPLGLKAEMTEKQAGREKDRIMQDINAQVSSLPSHALLRDFAAIYQAEHYRGLKQPSRDYYDARITVILQFLGERKLYQIGDLEISQLLGQLELAGVARKTRTGTKAVLFNIFEMARKWGYVDKTSHNPARDAEVGRSPGATRTKWTPTMEEAQAIMEAADEDVALILEFIIWTGLRISEVCGLRCKNVDLAQAVIYVRERNVRGDIDTPKGQRGDRSGERTIPLGYMAGKLAQLMGFDNDYLFRKDGVGYTDKLLSSRTRKAMRAVGHYHVGNLFHGFRRLHATRMSTLMNKFALMQQMGHARVETTELYVGDDLGIRKDALTEAQKVVPIRRKA